MRVIRSWVPREAVCLLLYVYHKSRQGDLTAAQVKRLRRVVREEFR